jgi:hypothetical protein
MLETIVHSHIVMHSRFKSSAGKWQVAVSYSGLRQTMRGYVTMQG